MIRNWIWFVALVTLVGCSSQWTSSTPATNDNLNTPVSFLSDSFGARVDDKTEQEALAEYEATQAKYQAAV